MLVQEAPQESAQLIRRYLDSVAQGPGGESRIDVKNAAGAFR
jgi:hypothetical protein